ncbi:DUF5309 family protein, partial [Kocuria sp. CPCC 205268]|uniref:SU10 major capsid protein n=1 Tax=Kocuria oxytropis TaxID=3058913 RepID=UPI0034D63A21
MDVFLTLIAGLNVSDPDTGAVVHKETPALTEAALFDLTYQLYLAGACPTVIMYHPKHAQFFSSLMEAQGSGKNRVRMFDGASDTKVSTYVSEIVDPLGCRFTLIPNRFAEEDIIYIYDARDFTQMVLRPFTRTQLAKTGSNEKWMIEAECGLRLRNPFAA